MDRKFETVAAYIDSYNPVQQKMLQQMRSIIQNAAPKACEVISYNMPAYKQNGVLVYFAMARNHLGFYPTASGIQYFKKELGDYKCSKGAVQFPLDKPLPKSIIQKIVLYRVRQDALKLKQTKGHDFLYQLSAPAQRALQNAGLTTLRKLASKTEQEILSLHGIGPSSLPVLRKCLKVKGLKFSV